MYHSKSRELSGVEFVALDKSKEAAAKFLAWRVRTFAALVRFYRELTYPR